MKRISFQFHSTEKEIFDFVKKWYKQYNLNVAVMQYFPDFQVLELKNIENIEKELNAIGNGTHKFIVFSLTDINFTSSKPRDFHAKNPNVLILQVGSQSKDYILESWLCTTVHIYDERSSKIWQKFLRELKKQLFSGAWAGNSENGDIEYYKDIRYTKGVMNAQKNGVAILPSKGKIYYDLLKEKP